MKPESRFSLRSGYSVPTIVEMLGLKKPLPQMMSARATKKAYFVSIVISRWPAAISRPPRITARREPSSLSASMPPMKGVAYTSEV